MKTLNIPQTEQKRVVVVGGGFAGLTLVQKLRKSNYQVVLVDQNNFHLFKPLLYQVASAGLVPPGIPDAAQRQFPLGAHASRETRREPARNFDRFSYL